MKKRNVLTIFIITFIAWVLFVGCSIKCFGAEKTVKKTVSQSTAKENQIRRQMFEACVQQTGSRSNCYRLYYN